MPFFNVGDIIQYKIEGTYPKHSRTATVAILAAANHYETYTVTDLDTGSTRSVSYKRLDSIARRVNITSLNPAQRDRFNALKIPNAPVEDAPPRVHISPLSTEFIQISEANIGDCVQTKEGCYLVIVNDCRTALLDLSTLTVWADMVKMAGIGIRRSIKISVD